MQNNDYIVSVKDLNPQEVLLLPISPDQKYHNNDMFSAILNFINESNLNVEIIIADTLRRFTYEMTGEHTPQAALENSIKLGEKWVEKNLDCTKNKEVYEILKKNNKIKVKHWNYFSEKYKEKLEELTKIVYFIYENKETSFHKAVNEAKNIFLKTFSQKYISNPIFNVETAELLNLEYLLEEYTVTLLWNTLGYYQLAYPVLEGITNKKLLFSGLISLENEIQKAIENKTLINFDLKKMKFLELSLQPKNRKNNQKSKQIEKIQQKNVQIPSFIPQLQKNFVEEYIPSLITQGYNQYGVFKSVNNYEQFRTLTAEITEMTMQSILHNPIIADRFFKLATPFLSINESYPDHLSSSKEIQEQKLQEFKI